MLSENSINALITISTLFGQSEIKWRLIGSSNLHLQNVPVIPRDIDIVIFTEHVAKVQSVLEPYCKVTLQYRESPQFRSYFGRFIINDTEVEIMSNLEIMKDEKWHASTAMGDEPIVVSVGGAAVPCASLKVEYDEYILMNRLERAEIIRKVMEQYS